MNKVYAFILIVSLIVTESACFGENGISLECLDFMGIYYSLTKELRTKVHENLIKAETTNSSRKHLVNDVELKLFNDSTIITAEHDMEAIRTLQSMANKSGGEKYIQCIVSSYGF
ncbi:hypothetical protein ACKWTF_016706 [Chironomus riparius]